MRRHKPEGISLATNVEEIVESVIDHHSSLGMKMPNQTHAELWTYDIGCNEDVALHWKYQPWEGIIKSFIDNKIFPTFATKHVNTDLLKFNPSNKARIRFSLMPQKYSTILEPNTSLIIDRIKAIDKFIKAGWDVHVNFSPVIFNPGARELYKNLFELLDRFVVNQHRVKSEVIFLTHNEKMHLYNLENNPEVEELLWNPERQEAKISSYGSKNIRYERNLKKQYITAFKQLHKEIIPWNTIRYIF